MIVTRSSKPLIDGESSYARTPGQLVQTSLCQLEWIIFLCVSLPNFFVFSLLIALTFDSIKIDYPMSFVTYGVVIPSNVHVEIRISNFLYVLDITSTIYTHQNKTVICFSLACVN